MSDQPILRVRNLSKKFPVKEGIFSRAKQFIHAVSDVNFELAARKTLGIVGESGSGKSTLARLAMRLIEADSGEILLHGNDLRKMDKEQLRQSRLKIQMIFQSPAESLNQRFTVEEILREPLEINKIGDSRSKSKKVCELLELVGLSSKALNRYAFEFSGGQRQRIAIARALATNPDILIGDEAVSALDISIQAQILNLLLGLQEELKLSLIFISHDLNVVRHISDQVLVMYLGKTVESGPTSKVLHTPAHPYTKALSDSIPKIDLNDTHHFKAIRGEIPSLVQIPPGCRFHTRCPIAKESCSKDEPLMRDIGMGEKHQVACPYFLRPK